MTPAVAASLAVSQSGVPDKAEVLRLVRERIEADFESIVSTHQATTAGATHEESKAENDKDTRALETTYLARGLAQRAAELSQARARLAQFTPRALAPNAPAALGALVQVEDEDTEERRWYFLSPAGGGLRFDVGGHSVAVVTAGSPVGDALLDKAVDDGFELRTPAGVRTYVIVDVS